MQAITWPNSPSTEAIGRVFEILLPGKTTFKRPRDGKECLLVSYLEDFNFLWKLDNELLRWLDGKNRTIVLVWDETPSEEKLRSLNVREYLSGFDWAVALSLSDSDTRQTQSDRFSNDEKRSWRLFILDLASKQHASSDTVRLFRTLQENKSILPWVSVYGIAQLTGFFCELMLTPARHAEEIDTDLLRRFWIGNLTKTSNPGARHAISNLIGPQVLLSGMGLENNQESPYSSPTLSALRNFLRSLGLVPSERDKEDIPWLHPGEWKKLNPKFILLDDMHEFGWAEFLRGALGISRDDNQRLAEFSNPNATEFGVERNRAILDLLKDDKGDLRTNQGLKLVPGDEAPILFLDLRLFSGRGEDEEIDFLKRLLPLAESTVGKDRPWRGFSEDEIAAIKRCVQTKRVENDDYFLALTMLPRLLAIVDPKLPIILFSSTGQRRVVDALRDYETVVLEFDKPRFFGENTAEVVTDTRVRFENAIRRALRILNGRLEFQRLTETTSSNYSTDARYNTNPYVEIYFDEGGDINEQHKFRVGGLILIFGSQKKADDFNRAMVDSDLVWGPTDIVPNPRRVAFSKYGTPPNGFETDVFAKVDELLKATDAMAVGFCLKRPVEIRRRGDPLELSSPSSLDNLHRRLTAIALEVVLFEVIPSVSKASRITCCVYLGTRRRYENPDVDAPGVWNEMPRRYGVNILPDGKKRYYRSIRSDGAYPIVAEVLSYGDQRSVKVVVARGAQLAYGAGTVRSEERPRPAHFLADLVTRFCLDESELSKFRSLQSWINRGFLSVADDDFSFLFQACRQARFERDVEALLAVSQARRLERWTKQRMVGILESISGNNFAEFCARVQYTVFFGNLPSSKAEESLRGLLSKEGCRILNLKISSNREGSAVAFVVFSSRAAAEYGIKQLNGVVINGRKIRVNWANKSFLF